MKKLLTTIFVCAFAYLSIAQDNTLPTTGNVGVGTLNPTARLNVNGSVKIDSSLVINDSLRVNKTIRVMDKVYIEGKTVMGDNAVVKQNFKVVGNSNFDVNATVDGNFKLPNAETLSNNNFTSGNFSFLVLNDNGVAKKGSYPELLKLVTDGIYDTDYPFPNDPLNLCNLVGYNPVWNNGPNKIYTGCPEVNVGIRTDDPRSALDVRGTTFTASLAIGIPPDEMIGKFHLKSFSSSGAAKLFTIENTTRKLLTLDNSGLLRAREIKVDAQAWPDYVFKSDYKLMPLSEVETFIQKEGHLPEFPSAQEVEENGMNVYETNKILVQKIEELTLHLIEQEKQLKEQNERLQELENKK